MPTWLVGGVRYTPQRGVAHPPSKQRPISLEYQIYLPAIDTIVTGLLLMGKHQAQATARNNKKGNRRKIKVLLTEI